MTTTTAPNPIANAPHEAASARTVVLTAIRTFLFILWRDIFVAGREVGVFLAQVIIEPFFVLFVFGKVLGHLGYTSSAYQHVLLPGVVALNSVLISMQNTALPLVIDFSYTKEVEDRLLSPIPTSLVAVEKMVFGALRGIIASVMMIPLGLLLLNDASWPMDKFLPSLGVLLMGSLAGSTVGLTIGTLAPPRHISVIFAVTLTPLMFTGCTQFPLSGLSNMPWFQLLCILNPLTYVSEGIRALMLPHAEVASVPLWSDLTALAGWVLFFGAVGIKGFHRRAQD
jgi:ABC-2 type transport system permease protein